MRLNKTILKLSLATALALSTAQSASDTIGYQGVAFNSGSPVASSTVGLQFTLYEDDNATVVYQESATATTTDKGYFSHDIGSGTASGTAWSAVQWGDNYTLKTEIDVAGGTSYTDLGIQEFKSVAYAKNGLAMDSVSATGTNAVAFGKDTNASGNYATAMGYQTTASGNYSTAMGSGTTASGSFSFAVGDNSVADNPWMTAVGKNNTENNTDALFVVGNGSNSGSRSDAFEVQADGDLTVTGNIYTGAGDYIQYSDTSDGTDHFGWYGNDNFVLKVDGYTRFWTENARTTINANNNSHDTDIDFNVPTRTNTYAFYVDASADRIGIGTNTPEAPLHIVSYTTSSAISNKPYFNANMTGISQLTTSGASIGLKVDSRYVIAYGFIADSDRRIKENITPITSSIDTLKKLRPVHYTKIDKVKDGNRKEYGFIAQELEEVIPEAVNTGKGEVPILKPYDKVDFEDGVTYTILVKNGDDIKQVKYTTADARPDGEIIVKSKEVDDFKSVTYDMVFTVAVDAIQEQQEEIEKLQDELTNIKNALKEAGINIK